jgi:putative PIN family toxin of toxin-antitoxin system
MTLPPRVVYDCNVLLQSLISQRGPAHAAVQAARDGRVVLFISQTIVDELRRVAVRPQIASRFLLTEHRVAGLIGSLEQCSHRLSTIPHVFDFDRDPDDAHYVDLAVAAQATLIVSRDNDLLSLGDPANADGKDFAARFPGIAILTPPQLLERLRSVLP